MIVVRRELITDDDHFQEIKQSNRALVKGKKQESSKPIILITGDSWAAGEWNRSLSFDDEFFHRLYHSMAFYLEKFYDCHVIYFPNPGWHDYESILACQTYGDLCDYIIFFKTCSLRCFNMTGPYDFTLDSWPEDCEDIYQIAYDINIDIYRHLETWKDKLVLFGGLTKIMDNIVKENKFFDIYPSVIELFDDKINDTWIMGFEEMWEVFKDKKYRKSLLDVMDTFANKKTYMTKKPAMYFPDNLHPNDSLQQKLAIMFGDKYLEKKA